MTSQVKKLLSRAFNDKNVRNEISESGLFDAEFYVANHSEAMKYREPLDYFIKVGLAAGHRPSANFDPALYFDMYPDVATSGQSALLHYIRSGRAEGRWLPDEHGRLASKIEASGLFDAEFYVALYPEVAKARMTPLEHFVRFGEAEGRRPSLEFDAQGYLAVHRDVAAAKMSPLGHFVEHGRHEGRELSRVSITRDALAADKELIADSGLFDVDFYLAANPVARRLGADPILHYLVEGASAFVDPSGDFSTIAYLAKHPEVVQKGEVPLVHYLRHRTSASVLANDVANVRRSRPINSGLYFAREDLALTRRVAYSFFVRHGFTLETSGPTTHAADAVAALAARQPSLRIDTSQPDVSIIIPVYGQMPFVLACLTSLFRHRSQFSVEIIIADDTSPAEHRTELLQTIPWVRFHRNVKNLGFLDNCNEAAKLARGQYIVLLNSDTWVIDGWLDELIGSFRLFPKAGLVGSQLLNFDGTLQEAGGLYWSDGTAHNYGRNGDPFDPRYKFARQADWISGASIAVPKNIWAEMGGFDEAFRPAYCEDTDLAFRIRDAGYEVWYQPLSCVIHFEGATHGRDEKTGVKAHQVTNLKRLQQRWKNRLPGRRPGGVDSDAEANRSAKKTMLVIDAVTHTPDRDAGSAVGWQMVKAFRDLGFHQTYVPLNDFCHYGRYTEDYQRVGVRILYSPFYSNIDDVLRMNIEYDYVLIHRYNVTQTVLDKIRKAMPTTRVIFVPADLHHVRMEREALLNKDGTMVIKAARAKTEELRVFSQVDCSMPHTQTEKDVVLKALPTMEDNIVVFPWVTNAVASSDDLGERKDIMFLGGFPHTPNVDAVAFFMADVWPQLVTQLPVDAKFMAVGNAPPEHISALASDRVVITGYVPEVEPYFAKARVFVAPLRFGAGIKGKVIQSLAHGVPTVATSIAVEGIGLVDGEHCLVADTPADIAAAIRRLYAEPETWARLREAGLRFVEEKYSWHAAMSLCERALEVADTAWMRREARVRDAWLQNLAREDGYGSHVGCTCGKVAMQGRD